MAALIRHILPLIPEWAVMLYTNRSGSLNFPAAARARLIDIRGDRLNAWERIRLPVAAFTDRLDLLHCPSQTTPPMSPCPIVLTVHDLIPIRIGDGLPPREVRRFYRALAGSVGRARRIIAVSEFTRRDLLSAFPDAEDKVDVVRWGVQSPASQGSSDALRDALRLTHGIRSPFFVSFGGAAPRKNVPRILEALAQFTRDVTADVQLVLVGVPSQARARFSDLANELGMSKHVVVLGYLPDETVSELLVHSEALVYPSLYEGFGLPILEAMALGAPVITSNVTSMPEIAGSAAILVDPLDSGAIAGAMRECYLNDTIKADLRARGLLRAEAFSWERAAQETLATYRRALGLAG